MLNYNSANHYFYNISDYDSLVSLNDWDNDVLQPENFFFFLRKSSFTSFFIDNLISVPNYFKKLKSLKRVNTELPILKLINFFFKKGKKEQYSKLFFKSLSLFFSNFNYITSNQEIDDAKKFYNIADYDLKKTQTIFFFKKKKLDWLSLYLLLNNTFNLNSLNLNFKIDEHPTIKFDLNYNNGLISKGKFINTDFFIKNFLQLKFNKLTPVFLFFIYNVDKSIKKFSRGKSGKYKFVWKYIPIQKRNNVIFQLLVKDIRFASGKKLTNRVQNSFFSTLLTPDKSFLYRSKIFTYNYIFKNYKKTLMSTLKTIK